MSVDDALKAALDPLEIPYAPNLYTGKATEYITTNFQTIPEVYIWCRCIIICRTAAIPTPQSERSAERCGIRGLRGPALRTPATRAACTTCWSAST